RLPWRVGVVARCGSEAAERHGVGGKGDGGGLDPGQLVAHVDRVVAVIAPVIAVELGGPATSWEVGLLADRRRCAVSGSRGGGDDSVPPARDGGPGHGSRAETEGSKVRAGDTRGGGAALPVAADRDGD